MALVVVLVLGALGLGGWKLLDGPGADAGSTPSGNGETSTREPDPVPTSVTIAGVTGALPPKASRVLREEVTALVDSWWDSAYLGGQWPRSPGTFDASVFGAFTRGAADQATDDRDVMSNARLADRTSRVSAVRRTAVLDVFALRGEALGVDATIKLVYKVAGADKRVTVSGTIAMARSATGRWKIFDYRVSRGAQPLAPQTGTTQTGTTQTGTTQTGTTQEAS